MSRFAALVLCTATLACSSPDPGSTRSLSGDSAAVSVVEEAIAHQGGARVWTQVRDVRLTGVRREPGENGSIRTERIRHLHRTSPPAIRIASAGPDGSTVTWGFDGSEYWTIRDGKRHTGPEAGGDARFWVWTYQWFEFMPFKLLAPGGTFEWLGKEEVEDETYDVVRLTFREDAGDTPEDIHRLHFETDPPVLRRLHFRVSGADPPFWEVVEIVEYAGAGGVRLPKLWRGFPSDETGQKTGPKIFEIEFRQIETNVGLDDSVFSAPDSSEVGPGAKRDGSAG